MATKSTVMKIGPATGSYVTLHTPRAIEEGKEPRYSISLIFKKATAEKELKALREMIDYVATTKFGPKWKEIPKFKTPIRDGDVDKPTHKEYADSLFINSSSTRRPGVVDRHLKPILSKDEHNDKAFSGCRYVIEVGVFAFDRSGSKGVSLGLNNVLVYELGERIDGRVDAAEAFKDFEEDGGGSDEVNPLD
jgi:hypothetical protein